MKLYKEVEMRQRGPRIDNKEIEKEVETIIEEYLVRRMPREEQ